MDDLLVLTSSTRRHSCKVCGKGFPCGRSLGGHMRSHALAEVALAAAAADEEIYSDEDDERRWIQSDARASYGVSGAGSGGYVLRENPMKTRRLSGSTVGDDDEDGGDACHDRDELLSSCRPVFGHVRRHVSGGGGNADDEHARVEGLPGEKDMLIPSDAEVVTSAPATRRRRRSMRVPAPPPASNAFDKEPEDVALCLIMLSRDNAGLWGSAARDEYSPKKSVMKKRDGFYHEADSDDNSALLQYADGDITKSKKRKTSFAFVGEKRGTRYECPGCGRAFQSYQALGGHRASHKRINSNCCTAMVAHDQPEQSVETNASCSTSSTPDAADAFRTAAAAVKAKKAIKFQCPICFKVFGSGQALGGHKRSHSIAGEIYERAHADGDAVVVDTEIAAGFLDLNLPAPGTED